jgi:hypothetical protein
MVAKKPTNYSLQQAMTDVANLRLQLGTPMPSPQYYADQTSGDIAAPGAGGAWYSLGGGYFKFISSNDGAAYDTGCQSQWNTSPITVGSTTPTLLFTFNVGAGIYRIQGILSCTNGSSGTLQPQSIAFGGTCAMTAMRVQVRSAQEGSVTSTAAFGQINSLGSNPTAVRTPALNEIFTIEMNGIFNVSTPGTFLVDGEELTSGSDVSYVVNAYSFVELMPRTT